MTHLDTETLETLWKIFKEEGEDAITLNHYELAEKTSEKNPEVWKAFLMNPTVIEWIRSELDIVQNTELKKMVKGAAKTRSVGQAQLINAFSKLGEKDTQTEGPTFIYMHVPLNNAQEHAPNAHSLDHNPFLKGE